MKRFIMSFISSLIGSGLAVIAFRAITAMK